MWKVLYQDSSGEWLELWKGNENGCRLEFSGRDMNLHRLSWCFGLRLVDPSGQVVKESFR